MNAAGTSGPATSEPIFAATLVSGERLELWPTMVRAGSVTYPLAQVVQAAGVIASSQPGAPPRPALLLRLADGQAPLFVLEQQADIERLLAALRPLRPDLWAQSATGPGGYSTNWPGNVPPPPPNYGAYGYPPAGAYGGYGPYGPMYGAAVRPPHPSGIPDNERLWAGFSHLSVFVLPFWFPLIVWLVTQSTMPYASRQAKQAFFFHLLLSGCALLFLPLFWIMTLASMTSAAGAGSNGGPFVLGAGFSLAFGLLWLGVLALGITSTVYSIIGAVRTFQGQPFHYPLLGRI